MSLLLGPHFVADAPPAGVVSIGDMTVHGVMSAYLVLGNDGILYQTIDGVTSAIGSWIAPQGGMDLYEARATATTTVWPTGTYGTWLDLAQSWSWGFSLRNKGTISGVYRNDTSSLTGYEDSFEGVPGKTGSFLLEIRRKSDGVVVDSCNVTVITDGNA